MTDIIKIQDEVNKYIANKDVLNALITTTFKGLSTPQLVKRAMMEGMMRGFTFENFLQKDIYAIPFKDTYSLVTSIDYARKIGMRSGIVGKSAPEFTTDKDGKIVSCSITVKRHVLSKIAANVAEPYIGDFTSTVYFSEYTTGRNLWTSKPHTMIAKVAEMHALRMACPEELSQMYVEEENQKEAVAGTVVINSDDYENRLHSAATKEELDKAFISLPAAAKIALKGVRDKLRDQFEHAEAHGETGKYDQATVSPSLPAETPVEEEIVTDAEHQEGLL
jgi:phage recombination protein Bet